MNRAAVLLDRQTGIITGEPLTDEEKRELLTLLDLPAAPAGLPENVAPPLGAGGGQAPGTRRAISGPTTRSHGVYNATRKQTRIGAIPTSEPALQALREIHALATRRQGDFGRLLAEIARKCEAVL